MSSEASNIIVQSLKRAKVSFFATFPCEKVRLLLSLIQEEFRSVALSREEEGVGICAGAYLAGARPAMLVQSSGIGNMVNALSSLTKTYQMPLLLLISWRGIYREQIPAQVPLGKKLPDVLNALEISYNILQDLDNVAIIEKAASNAYGRGIINAVLINPVIWGSEVNDVGNTPREGERKLLQASPETGSKSPKPTLTRLEILGVAAPYLEGKIVVCNLGIPSKELYFVKHQKSNFYMLGSMGLASSIGLGISIFTPKQVVVIDGDGSLLANLGSLSTIALEKPRNLTIIAVDNGVHGSTGNQPTATSFGVDLELAARALGFRNTYKMSSPEEISKTLRSLGEGPNFLHVLAKPGNAKVPNIPLTTLQIKQNTMTALRE